MRIGLDLDNTLAQYDHAFATVAKERGLLHTDFTGTKQQVRDTIRLLPDGEIAWQKLQGYVYGKGMPHARLFDGVDAFLRRCKRDGVHCVIVSHKTEFGHYDPERVNLRDAARGWLESQGFFANDGYGLKREDVYFESTRAEKVQRLSALQCDWFIDDLIEVYEEPHFPKHIQKILFTSADGSHGDWQTCATWQAIYDHIFRPSHG